jgi:hypothetical protein
MRTPCAACLLAVGVLAAARAEAQSFPQIWQGANQAYFRGDFERAASGYQRLVEAGVQDPDVYFNLGVAEARRGALGRALLAFERSAWLRPGDEITSRELTAARAALGRKRAERHGEATLQSRPPLVEALLRPFSAETLAFAVLVFDVLFFAVLLARRASRSEPLRLGLAIALPLLGLCGLLCALGLAVRAELLDAGKAAIVVRDGAELREGPDASAATRAQAYEGQSARVLERAAGFARVQLSGGTSGWMKQKDLGEIRPD